MGFSKKTKEDILVASARHCCVCHRYKGVKIEVHHIVPKNQKGKDTLDNAIALCFDCHADAGHYFAGHPRGTSFSPSELRKHKEEWFENVKTNNIKSPNENNIIHTRYFITSEFSIIKEILSHDLEHFPASNSLLLETPIFTFLKRLFKNQEYRRKEYIRDLNIEEDEYLNLYPNANKILNPPQYSHYIHYRTPSIKEIENYCNEDKLSLYLTSNGVDPSEICKVLTHLEVCGGGGFEELFFVRPLYIVLLTITNLSNNKINIDKADFNLFDGVKYFQESTSNSTQSIKFPKVSIIPNQSVVIPIGTILADFKGFEGEAITTLDMRLSDIETQTSSHGRIISNKDYEFVGPSLIPIKLYLNNISIEFHELDFNNLYWINRYWECGSCPHLFFEDISGNMIYQRELFNNEPNLYQREIIDIPENIDAIIIAELEKETTVIKSIKKNSKVIRKDVILHENNDLRIEVKKFDEIELEGMYIFKSNIFRKTPSIIKEKLIKKYIKNFTKEYI